MREYHRSFSGSVLESNFTFSVYPTRAYYDAFSTGRSWKVLIGAVLVPLGLGAFFFAFDVFNRRYTDRIHRAATVATAQGVAEREKIRGRHAFVSMISHGAGVGGGHLE